MKKIFFNKKGFTLIELLATIVVLSIVVSLTIYVALNIIGKAKEKSYKVTISNIESNASNYLLENKDKLNFVSSDGNSKVEYQCMTVKNLIDYGYLNDNITKSRINENDTVELDRYIYVERNSTTKAITKVVYLMDTTYDQFCKNAIKSRGNISFSSNPEFDAWSRSKDVTITYRLTNTGYNLNAYTYTYNYNYTGNSTPKTDNGSFNQFTETKATNITSNGTLLAEIRLDNGSTVNSNKEITKIDTVGPVIVLNSNQTKTVKATVTLPLKVTDVGSGINQDSFTKEDLLVKIGENTISNITLTKETCASNNECIYNLKIDDTTYAGKVTIKIDSNKVLDKIDNGNNETNINTNITFDNTAKYKINHYIRNMGENTYTKSGKTEEHTDNINATLTLADLKKTIAGFTYDGGYLTGNTTRPTGNKTTTVTLPANDNTVINLYYRRNYLYIQYNANGGVLADTHGEGYGLSNNLVTYNTQNEFKRGVYGGNVGSINTTTLAASGGLHNWNSTSYINLTYSGKVAKKEEEWCTSSGGGTCYDHNDTSIKAIDMATASGTDLSTGDKTIILYVNWMNATTVPTNTYCKTDLVYNGSSQTITKDAGTGYTFSNNVQKNAGSYTVTATLTNGYVWSDGTGGNKTFSCSIGKATPTITLSATSGNVVVGQTVTFNEKANVKGKFTVKSSDTGKATVQQESNNEIAANTNNLVTVKGVAAGSSTITVAFTPTDTTNYNSAQNKTYAVTVKAATPIPTQKPTATPKPTATATPKPSSSNDCGVGVGIGAVIGACVGAGGQWDSTTCTCTNKPTATPKPSGGTTPKPATPKPSGGTTPKPATPKPATPKPATPKPATPKPATPKPATPKPATPKPSGATTPTKKPCFLAGTKVMTINGYKDINKINVGDIVLSYNEDLDKTEYKKVLHLFVHRNETDIVYSLYIDDNVLKVTSAHRFYIRNNSGIDWIAAQDLKVGYEVMYADGTYHKIEKIDHEQMKNTFYNIEVEDNHNYYVGEKHILVHNNKLSQR